MRHGRHKEIPCRVSLNDAEIHHFGRWAKAGGARNEHQNLRTLLHAKRDRAQSARVAARPCRQSTPPAAASDEHHIRISVGRQRRARNLVSNVYQRHQRHVQHRVAGSGELTMGSLTAEGMVRLLSNMPPACQLSSHSTFLDVGSGVGQLPLFIRGSDEAHDAIGVEIDKCRHEAAVRRHESIRGALPAGDGLSYVRADVRNTGLYNATHVFLHSTCFGDELSRQIVRLATSATAVRCVLDLNDASDIERARSFAPFGSPVATTTLSSSGAPRVFSAARRCNRARSAAGAASAMAVLRRAGRRDRAAIDDSCGAAHRPPRREAKMKRSRNDGGGDPSLG